jgi:hypothetical protein
MKAKLVFSASILILLACRSEEPATSQVPAEEPAPVHVDSVFPLEEEIRRFKAARNGAAASELQTASDSRDALVARFMKALERRDTADLRAMVLNAAEYIDLYYPTSVYTRPPYKQSPELNWFLMQEDSEKGIKRALDRYGGLPANFQGYECPREPRVEGANRFWEACTIRWSPAPDVPSPIRIFGSIMEREERFKFVSYANDL